MNIREERPQREPNDPQLWLNATKLIDCHHPLVRETVMQVTSVADNDAQRATALFSHVRDAIAFGFHPAFWNLSASGALQHGVGHCVPKAHAFIALCRAAGIPARVRFMSLNALVLDGFAGLGATDVDHCVTEIFINGRWMTTDAYVIDQSLATVAKERLKAEGKRVGYGIHVHGTSSFETDKDSFIQAFLDPELPGYRSRDFGVMEDAQTFYAHKREGQMNRLTAAGWLAYRASIPLINRRILALRDSNGPPVKR